MSWQVNVSDNNPFGKLSVWIGEKTGSQHWIMDPVNFISRSHTENTLADPTLMIDEELGRALYEALARHFGPISDRDSYQQLRGDFEYERRRVDTLMDKLFGLTDRMT